MLLVKVDFTREVRINEAIAEAVRVAKLLKAGVEFEWREKVIQVSFESDADQVFDEYMKANFGSNC